MASFILKYLSKESLFHIRSEKCFPWGWRKRINYCTEDDITNRNTYVVAVIRISRKECHKHSFFPMC